MPVLDTLVFRLAAFAVLLVSGTGMLIGILSYERVTAALGHQLQQHLTVVAHDGADLLRTRIESYVVNINHWTRLEVMRALIYEDVDKELAKFLRSVADGTPGLVTIVCLNANNVPIVSTGPQASEFALSSHLREETATYRVTDADGSSFLALEARVPHPDDASRRIGTLITVIDPSSLLPAAPTAAGSPHLRVDFGSPPPSEHSVFTSSTPILLETASHGLSTPLGTAPLDSIVSIRRPELWVTAQQDRASALAPVRELQLDLLWGSVVAMILSAGAGVLVAWRIAGPIRRLTTVAMSISETPDRPHSDLAIPDTKGEVGLLSSAFRTMLTRLEAARNEGLARSRLALLGEIAANIAHEIRTPLSVLKASAQTLSSETLPRESREHLTALIAGEVDRLNGVVSDLVEIARPAPTERKLQHLEPLARRAIALCSSEAKACRIELVLKTGVPDVQVLCDGDQIYQILLNVLRNAMQAVERDGVVKIDVGSNGGYAEIRIQDTGPGFSEQARLRLFSPFFTTKKGGTGLGLAISRRIAQEHGGSLQVEGGTEGGAVFVLRVPQFDGGAS